MQPRVPVGEKKTSETLTEKSVGVVVVGKTLSLTGEFVGKIHRVLEHTQTHPPRNQHQKGSICWWATKEVTESQPRAQPGALFLFGPLPLKQCHKQ